MTIMANLSENPGIATSEQKERNQTVRFEKVLSREPFKGLKAILDSISSNREAQCAAVNGTASYEEVLVRLGYRITLTNPIHVQDCYSRVGPAGGFKVQIAQLLWFNGGRGFGHEIGSFGGFGKCDHIADAARTAENRY